MFTSARGMVLRADFVPGQSVDIFSRFRSRCAYFLCVLLQYRLL